MKNDRHSNEKVTYNSKLQESDNIINYVMDVNNFQNIRVGRHAFGLIGGPIINNSHTDIIDVESKLLGLDHNDIDTNNIKHLEKFQMIDYKEINIKE